MIDSRSMLVCYNLNLNPVNLIVPVSGLSVWLAALCFPRQQRSAVFVQSVEIEFHPVQEAQCSTGVYPAYDKILLNNAFLLEVKPHL